MYVALLPSAAANIWSSTNFIQATPQAQDI